MKLDRKMRIGIDLHNLSTDENAMVRTGIQQVVFNLLEAQSAMRAEGSRSDVELVPLPMLPLSTAWPLTRFPNARPTHVNNSPLVLEAAERELGQSSEELWAGGIGADHQNWSERRFYQVAATLDWMLITGLCDFSHVLDRVKAINPSIRVAVLVHDLVPLVWPELVARGMPEWFFHSFIMSIRHFATVVLCNSRHTALDCADYFAPILGDNVPIIATPFPPEVPELDGFHAAEASDWLARLGLEPQHYFVCLGRIEPRKNLAQVVAGFLRFLDLSPQWRGSFKLAMIGENGWSDEYERVLSAIGPHSDAFTFPGYLPCRKMELAMLCSSGLIMTSRYEGLGLPLSLANALGVPTVSCVNSSLPEASGMQTAFVRPYARDEIALALRLLASRKRSLEASALMAGRRDETRNTWRGLLESWVDVLRSMNGLGAPLHLCSVGSGATDVSLRPDQPSKSRRRPMRLCVEVHNLSLSPNELQKTGIQSVTMSMLNALARIRREFASEVEIICVPRLPDYYFQHAYAPTCFVNPPVLHEVERELQLTGRDLWGFDLEKYDYRLSPSDFAELVADADWLAIVSQFDVRRSFVPLKLAAPNVKISYLIYDLIPTLFPDMVAGGLARWFTYDFLRSVRQHAALALCDSRHTALDFLEFSEGEALAFPVYARLLPIRHNLVDGTGPSRAEIKQELGIYERHLFTIVGSTDPRKNVVRALEAFTLFRKLFPEKASTSALALVGPKVWRTDDVVEALKHCRRHGAVYELGYLSDADLDGIIAESTAVLMPSRYEGFGMPLAQARGHGVPALTCVNSSLPEVTATQAAFVKPWSVDEIALAMNVLIDTAAHEGVRRSEDTWLDFARDFVRLHLEERNRHPASD